MICSLQNQHGLALHGPNNLLNISENFLVSILQCVSCWPSFKMNDSKSTLCFTVYTSDITLDISDY